MLSFNEREMDMLDELTIYNLVVKYPNTIDFANEIAKMARADERVKIIDELTERYFDVIESILHDEDLGLNLNQALSIYARIMNGCGEIVEDLKEKIDG